MANSFTGAPDCINDGLEFYKRSVANQLDQTAIVFFNFGGKHICAMRLELPQCEVFIVKHHRCVRHHVCSKDCGEPEFLKTGLRSGRNIRLTGRHHKDFHDLPDQNAAQLPILYVHVFSVLFGHRT